MKHVASKLSLIAAVIAAASCGDPEIVVPDVLRVITVLPAHGSADVSADVEGLVYFSHPVADGQTAAGALSIECLGTPPCAAPSNAAACPASVAATVTFEANDQVAHLVPDAALSANTCYALVIPDGIEAREDDVGPLPISIRSSFYTRN